VVSFSPEKLRRPEEAVMAMDCAQIQQAPIMRRIVQVESGGNPYAIGVVGDHLVRQPRSLDEALATAQALESAGFNYSIGSGQINRVHFKRLGWSQDLAGGFDVCANLRASAEVLQECFERAVRAGYPESPRPGVYDATHAALSCYYSGDLVAGAQLGYVSKVLGAQAAVAPRHAGKRKAAPTSMMLD
jgi:type IV secretion system protein VirB1